MERSGGNNSSSLSSQVFSMFLETLVDFIVLHREDLQDWLFVLLTQLLKKMGADLLGSVQAKVQKALDVTRSLEMGGAKRIAAMNAAPFGLICVGTLPL